MTAWVGGLGANGAELDQRVFAHVAGVSSGEVYEVSSVVVAGSQRPERFGAVTALIAGELHDAQEPASRCGLPPDAPQGLIAARGYSLDGVGFLKGLRGSYQLALWDDGIRELIVSQDHLLARAVFYSSVDGHLRFASDLAPLLRVMLRAGEPDPETIPRWITDRSLPDGLTLFRGIARLPTGCLLRSSGKSWRVERVWEPEYVQPDRLSAAEARERLRAAVKRAVQRRVTMDGRTGILLSGGFDSGTLAGTAAPLLRAAGHDLPAYSTIFPGDAWDESADVRTLVRAFGLPSTEQRVSGGTLFTAARFQDVWRVPQPAPGSILDTPLLERARRDGLRVMLDGQGGDELFAASPYLLSDMVLAGRLAQAWRLIHSFPGTGEGVAPWQLRALIKQIVIAGGLPYEAHRRLARRTSGYRELVWMTPRSRRIAAALDDPWGWKRRVGKGPRWWAFLTHLQVDARELGGAQDYLRRRAAGVGIDSRQPLLTDVDLVSLMLSLPPEMAFSPHYDRALARDAMRGAMPESIRVPRRKSNYGELMFRTLAGPDLPELRRILAREDAEIGAFVDLESVRQTFLERAPALEDPGWEEWSQHVWALATTELWLRAEALGSRYAQWVRALDLRPPSIDVVTVPGG